MSVYEQHKDHRCYQVEKILSVVTDKRSRFRTHSVVLINIKTSVVDFY